MMNAEKIALKFLKTKTLIIYISLMSLVFFSALAFSLQKIMMIKKWNAELSFLKDYAEKTRSKRKQNDLFFQRHVNASSHYITLNLEPMNFLVKEQKLATHFKNHPAYGGRYNTDIQKVNPFQKENRLIFKENHSQIHGKIKEIHLSQEKPIFINFDDLECILSKIEECSIGPYFHSNSQPQILIDSFHLKKSSSPMSDSYYELNLTLFQREFSKK